MSDRIAYLIGNTNHRDLVNWPTILESQLAGLGVTDEVKNRNWPGDVNEAQLLALAWRVRTWRLTGGIDARWHRTGEDYFYNADITAELDRRTGWADESDQMATQERSLLSQVYGDAGYTFLGGFTQPDSSEASNEYHYSKTSTFGDDSEDVPFDPTVILFHADPGSRLVIYRPGEALPFSPVVFFSEVLRHIPVTVADIDVTIRTARTPETVAPPSVSVTGSLVIDTGIAGSFTVPLQMIISGFLAGDETSVSTAGSAVDLEFTAETFWPYKNSEGLPVYDADTGAQLRDPFS